MANSRSAEKRVRQDAARRSRNRAYRTRMRTSVKRLRGLVAAGDAEAARQALPETLATVDATCRHGVIHRNAAARTKSRLERAVRSLAGS